MKQIKESTPLNLTNNALSRLVNESRNPYHEIHVNKAYEVKKPKLDKLSAGPEKHSLSDGNPWLALKK